MGENWIVVIGVAAVLGSVRPRMGWIYVAFIIAIYVGTGWEPFAS